MINLLDSFVDRRYKTNKNYLLTIGLIFLFNFFFILFIDFNLLQQKSEMIQTQAFLVEKLNHLSVIEREEGIRQKKIHSLMKELILIKELSLSSFLSKVLFKQLLSSFPEKIYLKQISREGNLVKLEGFLQPPANLPAFFKTLEKNEWFAKPRLIELKKGRANFINFFKCSFVLKTKSIFVKGI